MYHISWWQTKLNVSRWTSHTNVYLRKNMDIFKRNKWAIYVVIKSTSDTRSNFSVSIYGHSDLCSASWVVRYLLLSILAKVVQFLLNIQWASIFQNPPPPKKKFPNNDDVTLSFPWSLVKALCQQQTNDSTWGRSTPWAWWRRFPFSIELMLLMEPILKNAS